MEAVLNVRDGVIDGKVERSEEDSRCRANDNAKGRCVCSVRTDTLVPDICAV